MIYSGHYCQMVYAVHFVVSLLVIRCLFLLACVLMLSQEYELLCLVPCRGKGPKIGSSLCQSPQVQRQIRGEPINPKAPHKSLLIVLVDSPATLLVQVYL